MADLSTRDHYLIGRSYHIATVSGWVGTTNYQATRTVVVPCGVTDEDWDNTVEELMQAAGLTRETAERMLLSASDIAIHGRQDTANWQPLEEPPWEEEPEHIRFRDLTPADLDRLAWKARRRGYDYPRPVRHHVPRRQVPRHGIRRRSKPQQRPSSYG